MTLLVRAKTPPPETSASQVNVRNIVRAAAAIGAIRPLDTHSWLHGLTVHLRTHIEAEIECTASLFVNTGERSTWPIELMAWSSGYAPGYQAVLRGCATRRAPDGLYLGLPAIDDLHGMPTTRTREDLLSSTSWRHSPLSVSRERHGLYEFMWSAVRVDGGSMPRVLVVQCDSTDERWHPSEAESRALGLLLDGAQQTLVAGPLTERERREALLAKLSPMRRKVAPMLATGQSETAIAELLGRSKHTVHEHAKAIYAAWGVSTRHGLRDLWFGDTSRESSAYETAESVTPGIG